jgi:chromosomal replication initiator protein
MSRGTGDAAVWTRVCTTLRHRIGERNFATWIAPLRSTWADGDLALEAPDRVVRDRVARHFLRAIEDALADAIGRAGAVRLGVAGSPPILPLGFSPPTAAHTFDTFVVGASNEDACAAARALVERDSTTPWPLFLHGPSGVGKTHLLHAVYHALDANGVPVACLPAAHLVSALVAAYETGADARWWSDLSPVRVVLLDDAHSVHGLEETQERMMEGLERWVAAGRTLVLTSDRAFADMPGFAARLRARFAHGVVASIARPDPALRLAILHRKALRLGVRLDDRLAERLAHDVGGNVRRLEGALTRLVAHARLADRPVDEALAHDVLPELAGRKPEPVTVERIIDATATVFGVSARRLRGRARDAALTLPRQVAMYVARTLLEQPFAQLAAAFGRHHTTVLQGFRTVAARRLTDGALSGMIDRVVRRIEGEEEP